MRKKNRPHRSEADATPRTVPAVAGTAVELSQWKRRVFRLVSALLVPLVSLALLEITLRLGGYGFDTNFFRPARIDGADYLVENDKFGLRFFPPSLARSPPPVVMRARKAPGSYRIFILGESAALGDPRPAYGAGRYLRVLLEQRFPGMQFEVICVAMTAVNSHAILPIARECARYEPDCWIIYMGNNEMVGPFGAASVFGARAPPGFIVRIALAAQQLRLGQLVAALGQKFRSRQGQTGGWAGMEMFLANQLASDDTRCRAVERNFAANLDDILRVTLETHAPVLLNTVAVNLRNCAPFASRSGAQLSAAQRDSFELLSAQARVAAQQKSFEAAARLFAEAARIQPQAAEVQYQRAESLLAMRDPAAAELYQLACDEDALPFRATSKLNSIIHDASARAACPSLVLLDAATRFATNAPAGSKVPGDEVFYEHVHLNFDGNYLLGRAWAEQVSQWLAVAAASRGLRDWASQADCEAELGLTDWNRSSVFEDMALRLQQPPFSGQLHHTERMASLKRAIEELHQRMNTNTVPAARDIYEKAIEHHPADHRLHENFAEFLEAIGDLREATAEWRRVAALLPQHHLGFFQAGRLLALQGNSASARSNLLAAVRLRPDLSEGWFELGKLSAGAGEHDIALGYFAKARELLPQDPRVYYYIGKSFSKLGKRADAVAQFRKAVQLRPNSWQARYALAEELGFNEENQEACTQLKEVLRLKPDHVAAHLNLGVALFKLGRTKDAKAEFTEALRLNPQNKTAQDYLRQLETPQP